MFRSLAILVLILSIFTLLSALVPDTFTSNVDNSISYFAGQAQALNAFVDVSTAFSCLELLIDYFIILIVFIIFLWIARRTSGGA